MVHKEKELILMMEDDVDSEDLLKIFSGNTVEKRKRTNEITWNYC